MKIIDFGRNTYQHEIGFKFDCISPELVRDVVREMLVSKKQFSTVAKEGSTNQTYLTRGEGTESSPLFQVRIGSDKIVLWAGWYVPFEKWQEWRNAILLQLTRYVEPVPIEVVGALTSQYVFLVPSENLKQGDSIPELQPIREFYKRFIPRELIKRGNVYLVFGDEQGKETLTWWTGGSTAPGEENITFIFRSNVVDAARRLEENLLAHTARSDGLLKGFHAGLLSLLVKT